MPKVSAEHLTARRQQIVAVATTLFAERGFSRTTMADVVSASGLSTGAVYHYFPGKADLVLAVVADRDGTIDGRLPSESPAELIGRLTEYVAPDGGEAHARLVAQIWGDAAVDPGLAAVASRSHQRLEAHLAGLLRANWAESGAMTDDAPAVAQVALAALVGLSALVAAGVPVDADDFAQVVSRLLASSPPPAAESQDERV